MFGTRDPNAGDDSSQRSHLVSRADVLPGAVDLPRAGGEDPRDLAATAALRHHLRVASCLGCGREDHRPGDRVEAFG